MQPLIRLTALACVLTAAPACDRLFGKSSDDAKAEGGGAAEARRSDCEKIAADAGVANPPALVDKCLKWSDDVFACRKDGGDAAKCGDKVVRADGGGAGGGEGGGGGGAAGPTVEGGPVLWQVKVGQAPKDVQLSDDGTVIMLLGDRVIGVRDSQEVWVKEGAYSTILRLQDGTLVMSIGHEVLAVQPGDGSERFKVGIPVPASAVPKKGKKPPPPPPAIITMATVGSQALLAVADARFYIVDPPSCENKQPSCVQPAGRLEGEYFDPGTKLVVGSDGTRYLGEEEALRAFDLGLDTLMELEAPANISGIVPAGGDRMALSSGGKIHLLAAGKCRGEFSLRRAPSDCVVWSYKEELDDVAPAVIDQNTLAANGGRRLQAVSGGTDLWKSPLGSVGRVISDGQGVLFVVAAGEKPGDNMNVKAVRADKGTVIWETPLPYGPGADGTIAVEKLYFDRAGAAIVAGYDLDFALIGIPGAG